MEITILGCIGAFAGIFLILVILSPLYSIHKERVRLHNHVLKTIKELERESKAQ